MTDRFPYLNSVLVRTAHSPALYHKIKGDSLTTLIKFSDRCAGWRDAVQARLGNPAPTKL